MLLEELPKVEKLDNDAVKALFKQIQKATKLKGKDVFMPIRVALTGNQHGPELAAMVPLLGVELLQNVLIQLGKNRRKSLIDD